MILNSSYKLLDLRSICSIQFNRQTDACTYVISTYERNRNMSKRVAIVQSNYIPWKGYFDLINQVDEFILYDDMQYTRRDWRNRNRIKTANGLRWLTIPVNVKGKFFQAIKDTEISDPTWANQHWKTIEQNYRKTPHFVDYAERILTIYTQAAEMTHLSMVNYLFLIEICELLGIKTHISWSMDYVIVEGKTERLVSLCQQAAATHYLSGPAARGYLDESLFTAASIAVEWMDYNSYPEYPQLYPPFEHSVSVLDLLLNTGAEASRYICGEITAKRWDES